MKNIIINADDFGISEIFNAEILMLLSRGFLTSTTVMVDRIDIEKQKDQLFALGNLQKSGKYSIGLHLEFQVKSFETEIRRQYDKFIDILGFKPSHLDLHKLSFIDESFPYIEKFCIDNKMPCRNMGIYSSKVIMTSERAYSGTYKTIEDIFGWISNIDDNDVQEILFHPGIYDQNCKSSLNRGREDDAKNVMKLSELIKNNDINMMNYLELIDFKKEI